MSRPITARPVLSRILLLSLFHIQDPAVKEMRMHGYKPATSLGNQVFHATMNESLYPRKLFRGILVRWVLCLEDSPFSAKRSLDDHPPNRS
jgi:hypothetical protein